jgi:hypothetical protein
MMLKARFVSAESPGSCLSGDDEIVKVGNTA